MRVICVWEWYVYKCNKFHIYESDRWKFNSYCVVLELYWKGNLVKEKKRENINDERILRKRRITWRRILFSWLSRTTWWMGVCERIQRKECTCMREWNLDIMNRGKCHSLPSLLLEYKHTPMHIWSDLLLKFTVTWVRIWNFSDHRLWVNAIIKPHIGCIVVNNEPIAEWKCPLCGA